MDIIKVQKEFIKKGVVMESRLDWLIMPILLLICVVPLLAETHRFEPTRYYNTFSFSHPPVLEIEPGDRVLTTTIDAHKTAFGP